MKLLTKTSYYYILYTIPVLILTTILFYFFLLNEIGESNESLLQQRVEVVENYIKNEDVSVISILESNNEVFIKEIEKNKIINQKIEDTLIFSKHLKEDIAYKVLEVNSIINGKNYKIKVLKSTIEFDELMEVVLINFVAIVLLLFSIIYFINIKISKKLWQPFWFTLDYIKNFNVTTTAIIKLESSDITEFEELNSSMNQMTSKMVSDYHNQKKFAENASHEFQTPFAIIKGKIDILLQNKDLDLDTLKTLISIDDATIRLSRINKSLLLLSKIENRQYQHSDNVLLLSLIDKCKALNEDFILDKNIKFNLEDSEELYFKINYELCYILFNNLMQNAIRHNVENGSIIISIKNNSICISNTGIQIPLNSHLIFERFEKQSNNPNSIGLGLSIVKEIAEVYNINISYSYENKLHVFTLNQLA
ncbi:sensor histidine kinase [Flavobacterium sp. XS1P32]|uniref:sensor histidine kinase n=1 Tax=Flavobacterium sp. XS1P32 TaxID=3401726 RepID=UPI003AB0FE1B